jgi:hypothetical protein
VVFDRPVDAAATVTQLGAMVLEAIEVAMNPPQPRFPWTAFALACARWDGYLMQSFQDSKHGVGQQWTRLEVLDAGVDARQLGAAARAALLDTATRSAKERDASAKALWIDPKTRAMSSNDVHRIQISFHGASDLEHIQLLAQEAFDSAAAGKTKVRADCNDATLGGAILSLFRKMGVTHRARRQPPLSKLHAKGAYRALIVSGKPANVRRALEKLRERKMVAWCEMPRSKEISITCAARLSDGASAKLDPTLALLQKLSTSSHVAMSLVIAAKSNDVFVYANYREAKVLRLLEYGWDEQHSWSRVEGRPRSWEKAAFDFKRLKEKSVRTRKSKVVVTDAMRCAEKALAADYE